MKRKSVLALFLVVVLVTALFPSVSAALVGSSAPSLNRDSLESPNGPAQVEDDGGTAEMGVEWITDWPGTGDDRANWYYSASNLYNELLSRGWIGRFNWGNTNAWERDFKPAGGPYGGNGDIDTVDLALIGTHGTSAYDPKWHTTLSAVYFSSNNDDWYLSPGEAYRYYGTNDLEWLAFDSCSVLRDDSMWYWHETFNGLHLMLGFANTMYVVYPGDGGVWADQMRWKGWWHPAKTVTQAWFSAVSNQQPHGVLARVLAEELNNYNDYMWGEGYVSPDYANNGGYWYWDHWSGTPDPLQLTAAAPISLPVYTVMARTVDMTYTARIGYVFDLTDTSKIYQDGSTFYMVDVEAPQPPFPPPTLRASAVASPTKLLQVDMASGGYSFMKLDELWTKPEMSRTLPTSDQAATAAASIFLRQHGESLPGYYSQYFQIVSQTVQLEGAANGLPATTTSIAASTPTSPTNYAVDYARALAIGDGQQISIVGPGSRLNAYIGDNSQVVGLQGGWRDVEPAPVNMGVQSTAAVTVPIRTAEQAWAVFIANPRIALAQPPAANLYITATKPLPTLAYYEQASVVTQTELIPVWVFVADLYTSTATSQAQVQSTQAVSALVASDVSIYVPASAAALVQANITSPTAGTKVMPGQSLILTGTVSGGLAPWTFQWSSSVDGELGAGPTLTIPGLHSDVHNGNPQPNIIYLLVTDANGQQSTATVDVAVFLQMYLPVINKQ